MIVLIPLGAILLSALIQRIVRGGSSASAEAPHSLWKASVGLLLLGTLISIAPLLPLAIDLFTIRSVSELLVLVVFLLITAAMILASWIWAFVVWRHSATRSSCAFAVAASIVNVAIAIMLYRGLASGIADSQDGIVVHIVPLLQIVVTAASLLIWRGMDRNWGTRSTTETAAPHSGAGNRI